eukprot:Clim_evm18s195 gene=Clim_evmTU18s195
MALEKSVQELQVALVDLNNGTSSLLPQSAHEIELLLDTVYEAVQQAASSAYGDALSTALFDASTGLLTYIEAASSNASEGRIMNVRQGLTTLLHCMQTLGPRTISVYLYEIETTVFTLFHKSQQATIRVACIECIEWFLTNQRQFSKFGAEVSLDKLYAQQYEAYYDSKVKGSVRATILELLGIFARYAPQFVQQQADGNEHRLLTILVQGLQGKNIIKGEESQECTGSFKGLTNYCFSFPHVLQQRPKEKDAIFSVCLRVLQHDPGVYTRYHLPKAVLTFISHHVSIFHDILCGQYDPLFSCFHQWLTSVNREVKIITMHAVAELLKTLSQEERPDSMTDEDYNKMVEYFLQNFKTMFLKTTEKSFSQQLRIIAVEGFGYFAKAYHHHAGQRSLKHLYDAVQENCNKLFMSRRLQDSEILDEAPVFLMTLTKMFQELEPVDHSRLQFLNEFTLLTISHLTSMQQVVRSQVTAAAKELFDAMLNHPRQNLAPYARSLAYQAVYHIVCRDHNDNASLDIADLRYQTQADAALSGLTSSQIVYRDFVDRVVRSKSHPETASCIFGFFMENLMEILEHLDLTLDIKNEHGKDEEHEEKPKAHVEAAPNGEEQQTWVSPPKDDEEPDEDSATVRVLASDFLDFELEVRPQNPLDFAVFENVVWVTNAMIKDSDDELFRSWLPYILKHCINMMQKTPHIAGYYDMLEKIFLRAATNECSKTEIEKKENLSLVVDSISIALQHLNLYEGVLMRNCMRMLLAIPQKAAYGVVGQIFYAAGISLDHGLNDPSFGFEALDALAKWRNFLPPDVYEKELEHLAPVFGKFLDSRADTRHEGTIQKDNLPGRAVFNRKKGQADFDGSVISTRFDSPRVQLQRRVMSIIAGARSTLVYGIAEASADRIPMLEFTLTEPITYRLPLDVEDYELHLDLNHVLPHLVRAAKDSGSRQARIASCEVLHAVFVLAHIRRSHSSSGREKMAQLYRRYLIDLIGITCSHEVVARQILGPYIMQQVRYLATEGRYEEPDLAAFLDATFVGLADRTNGRKRIYCARIIAEFVRWSVVGNEGEHADEAPRKNNELSIFQRLTFNLGHSQAYRRLGASIAVGYLLRILARSTILLNRYFFEVLEAVFTSYRLPCGAEIRHEYRSEHERNLKIMKKLAKKYRNTLIDSRYLKGRRAPRRFPATANDCIRWLFGYVGDEDIQVRYEAMHIIKEFTALVEKREPAVLPWVRSNNENMEALRSILKIVESDLSRVGHILFWLTTGQRTKMDDLHMIIKEEVDAFLQSAYRYVMNSAGLIRNGSSDEPPSMQCDCYTLFAFYMYVQLHGVDDFQVLEHNLNNLVSGLGVNLVYMAFHFPGDFLGEDRKQIEKSLREALHWMEDSHNKRGLKEIHHESIMKILSTYNLSLLDILMQWDKHLISSIDNAIQGHRFLRSADHSAQDSNEVIPIEEFGTLWSLCASDQSPLKRASLTDMVEICLSGADMHALTIITPFVQNWQTWGHSVMQRHGRPIAKFVLHNSDAMMNGLWSSNDTGHVAEFMTVVLRIANAAQTVGPGAASFLSHLGSKPNVTMQSISHATEDHATTNVVTELLELFCEICFIVWNPVSLTIIKSEGRNEILDVLINAMEASSDRVPLSDKVKLLPCLKALGECIDRIHDLAWTQHVIESLSGCMRRFAAQHIPSNSREWRYHDQQLLIKTFTGFTDFVLVSPQQENLNAYFISFFRAANEDLNNNMLARAKVGVPFMSPKKQGELLDSLFGLLRETKTSVIMRQYASNLLLSAAQLVSVEVLRQFFVRAGHQLLRFLRPISNTNSPSLQIAVATCTLLEVAYDCLPKEDLAGGHSEIAATMLGTQQRDGTELTKTLVKELTPSKDKPLPEMNEEGRDVYLLVLKYKQRAYRALCSVLLKTQSRPKVPASLLIGGDGKAVLKLLEGALGPAVEITLPLGPRVNSGAEGGTDPTATEDYMSSSYLNDGSLANRSGFLKLNKSLASKSIASAATFDVGGLVYLENEQSPPKLNHRLKMVIEDADDDFIDNNEVLPKLLDTLDFLNELDPKSEQSGWIEKLLEAFDLALNQDSPAMFYIAKLVRHRSSYFRSHSSQWGERISQFLLRSKLLPLSLSLLAMDLLLILLDWGYVPEDHVAQDVVRYYSRNFFINNQRLLSQRLETLRAVMERWGGRVRVTWADVKDNFKPDKPQTKLENVAALNVLDCFFTNQCFHVVSLEEILSSLMKTFDELLASSKVVYKAAAEACGAFLRMLDDTDRWGIALELITRFTASWQTGRPTPRYIQDPDRFVEIVHLMSKRIPKMVTHNLFVLVDESYSKIASSGGREKAVLIFSNCFDREPVLETVRLKGLLKVLEIKNDGMQHALLVFFKRAAQPPVDNEDMMDDEDSARVSPLGAWPSLPELLKIMRTTFPKHPSQRCRQLHYQILQTLYDTCLGIKAVIWQDLLQSFRDDDTDVRFDAYEWFHRQLPKTLPHRLQTSMSTFYLPSMSDTYIASVINEALAVCQHSSKYAKAIADGIMDSHSEHGRAMRSLHDVHNGTLLNSFAPFGMSQQFSQQNTLKMVPLLPNTPSLNTATGSFGIFGSMTNVSLGNIGGASNSNQREDVLSRSLGSDRLRSIYSNTFSHKNDMNLDGEGDLVKTSKRDHDSRLHSRLAIRRRNQRILLRLAMKRGEHNRITVFGDYSAGNFPDESIPHRNMIAPLQSLCQQDPVIAQILFVEICKAVLKAGENDGSVLNGRALELARTIKDVLSTVHSTDQIVPGPMAQLAADYPKFIRGDLQFSHANNAGSRASCILALEESLLQQSPTDKPEPKRRKKEESLSHVADKYVQLAAFYQHVDEVDVVQSLFHVQDATTHQATKDAIGFENRNHLCKAHNKWVEALNKAESDTTFLTAEIDYIEDKVLSGMKDLGEWFQLTKYLANQADPEKHIFDRPELLPDFTYVGAMYRLMGGKNTRVLESVQKILEAYQRSDQWHYTESEIAEQLMLLDLSKLNFSMAQVHAQTHQLRIQQTWTSLHPHMMMQRAHLLMDLQLSEDVTSMITQAFRLSSGRQVPPDFFDFLANARDQNFPLQHQLRRFTVLKGILSRVAATQEDGLSEEDLEVLGARHLFILQSLQRAFPMVDQHALGLSLMRNAAQESDVHKVTLILKQNQDLLLSQPQSRMRVGLMFIQTLVSAVSVDAAVVDDLKLSYRRLLEAVSYPSLGELDHADDLFSALKILNTLAINPEVAALKIFANQTFPDVNLTSPGWSDHVKSEWHRCMQLCESGEDRMDGVDGGVETSLFDVHMEYALFWYKLSRTKGRSDELKDADIGPVVISHILKSIALFSDGEWGGVSRHGRGQCVQSVAPYEFIPLLLKTCMKSSKSRKIFADEWRQVPAYRFLDWIPQLIVLLGNPLMRDIVSQVVKVLAVQYPQAVFFPFKATWSQGEGGNREPHRDEHLVEIEEKLDIYPILRQFHHALLRSSGPRHRFRIWLDHVQEALLNFRKNCGVTGEARWSARVPFDLLRGLLWELEESLTVDKTASVSPQETKFWEDTIEKIWQQVNTALPSSTIEGGMEFRSAVRALGALRDWSARLEDPVSLRQLSGFFNYDGSDPFAAKIDIPGQYHSSGVPDPRSIVTVHRFDTRLRFMPSLMRPFKFGIVGSDEREYNFLLKAGEDMRIDERILQLLRIMDSRLKDSQLCRERGLTLKTYAVHPLSSQIGLIEFIDKVQELKPFILSDCTEEEHKVATRELPQRAHTAFMGHRKNNKHVLFNYVERTDEDVRSLQENLTKRMPRNLLRRALRRGVTCPEAYVMTASVMSRSYATMCIAHYLLGIGDRHLGNTMVSKIDGRMIGIDFGHAFDSAIVNLGVPELMPFRFTDQIEHMNAPLTREAYLVPAMCHTLEVFRRDPTVVLSIMDLYASDPLFKNTGRHRKRVAQDLSLSETSTDNGQQQNGGLVRANDVLNDTEPRVHDTTVIFEETISEDVRMRFDAPRLKMQGYHPMRMARMLVKQNVHAAEHFDHVRRPLDELLTQMKREGKSENFLGPVKQLDCLITLATDSGILGRTWPGWEPWV